MTCEQGLDLSEGEGDITLTFSTKTYCVLCPLCSAVLSTTESLGSAPTMSMTVLHSCFDGVYQVSMQMTKVT